MGSSKMIHSWSHSHPYVQLLFQLTPNSHPHSCPIGYSVWSTQTPWLSINAWPATNPLISEITFQWADHVVWKGACKNIVHILYHWGIRCALSHLGIVSGCIENIVIPENGILRRWLWVIYCLYASRRPIRYHGLTLIPPWISNHMSSKVWDKITY